MAQNILLKRSSLGGKIPTTAQLALGEIAINTHDGKLYIKQDDSASGGGESIVTIGDVDLTGKADKVSGATLNNFASLDASGNLLDSGFASGDFSDINHVHTISDITDLAAALNGKLGKTENAVSASQWLTARTITLSGDVSGSVSIDGTANVTLNATVADNSHLHDQYAENAANETITGAWQFNESVSLQKVGQALNIGGGTSLDGSDAWIRMGNATYGWELKYVGSTSGDGGNEFRIQSTSSGRYWQMDHAGNYQYYDGANTRNIFHDGYHPNADKWTTARTIALSGDVSGSVAIDGSANVTITTTVANNSHTHTEANITDLDKYTQAQVDSALALKVNTSELAVPNGVATLDGSAKLTASQIPDSLLGGLTYQGTWNASTNTPTLTSGVGTQGHYYRVNVAGNTDLDGITNWEVSDWAVFNGTVWERVDNTNEVTSVAGKTGDVILVEADITNLDKYSRSAVDGFISGRAPLVHTHVEADITDLDKYTQSEVDGFISGRAPLVHTHVEADITDLDKYTQSEVDSLISNTAPAIHDHDDLYYRKAETNAKYVDVAGDTMTGVLNVPSVTLTNNVADFSDKGSVLYNDTSESFQFIFK